MRWSDLTSQQPALAAIAQDKALRPGVLIIGTARRDGSARISGVEPLVMAEDLWLSMLPTSMKVRDLRRDPRIWMNSVITGPEPSAEIKLRGTVRAETRDAVLEHYAAAVAATLGWRPVVGQFVLFAVDLEAVIYIGYDPATSGQHVAQWPAGIEYIRPATTPTSLGPPQTVHRLLR